ncbi:MAG: hypothetical protein ACTHNU_11090 [Gaiellales bacterium]
MSLTLLAMGISVSAAQARPFELPAGAVTQQASQSPERQPAQVHNMSLLAGTATTAPARGAVDTRGWTESLLSSDSSKAAAYAAAHPQQPVVSSGNSVNWTAVGVGATISVILIGALGVGMFRTRLRRPAAA